VIPGTIAQRPISGHHHHLALACQLATAPDDIIIGVWRMVNLNGVVRNRLVTRCLWLARSATSIEDDAHVEGAAHHPHLGHCSHDLGLVLSTPPARSIASPEHDRVQEVEAID
jgi:hypothetical protein